MVIRELLIKNNISTKDSIEKYSNKVRDSSEICSYRCKKSGVIFLDKTLAKKQSKYKYWNSTDIRGAIASVNVDTKRRSKQFSESIINKKWLDIGTGAGGILFELKNIASEISLIEPQKDLHENFKDFNIFNSINEIEGTFDVITMFHVFEHLEDPINALIKIKKHLKPNGKLIIEIPHANDFLLSYLELESFKKFTLWSEHLILHTRESLSVFLKKAGFTNISIKGFQRYPISNHLYWLSKEKPGGHIMWNNLNSEEMDTAYSNMLSSIDCNDTLIAEVIN